MKGPAQVFVLPSTAVAKWEPFIFILTESLVSSNPLFLVTKRKQELGSFATNLEAKEMEQAENIKSNLRKGKNHLVTCTLKIFLVLICFFE